MLASQTLSTLRALLAGGAVLAVVALVACDGTTAPPDASPDGSANTEDAATPADGGSPRDAGSDASVRIDSGVDGGDIDDAGAGDAGSSDDAGGGTTDGGPVSGACTSNADCSSTQLCNRPLGMCGEVGTCEAIPVGCSFIFLPVCGCDGMTYSNECLARFAGVAVDKEGDCPVAACSSNADCSAAQFCNRPSGDCGAPGACEDRPFICGGIFLPVCGCDGMTYGNECNARAAGTSVGAEGECGG